jgi:hypothetical protein
LPVDGGGSSTSIEAGGQPAEYLRNVFKTPITIHDTFCLRYCHERDQMNAIIKGVRLSDMARQISYEKRPGGVGRIGPSRPAT